MLTYSKKDDDVIRRNQFVYRKSLQDLKKGRLRLVYARASRRHEIPMEGPLKAGIERPNGSIVEKYLF